MSILQIELSDRERQALESYSKDMGKSVQAIVKEALNEILQDDPEFDWKAALMQGAGMWKDRDDIPLLMHELRNEMNRVEPPEEPK